MNIYIYGSKGFKEEIHKTLEHANIKFKIDVDARIEDIDTLDELKEKIVQAPSDIYLIDEEKIIKKSLLNQKIKLFTPKDAIEQDFLLENGVADVSVESLDEIPKYIVKKFEEHSPREDIQDSIIEIVDEAYTQSDNTIDLDDELSALLEPEEKNSEFKEDVGLSNTNSDYDDENTHEDAQIEELSEIDELDEIKEIEKLQEGEENSVSFDSLDEELKELDALELDNNEDLPNVEDELDSLLELDEVVTENNEESLSENFTSLKEDDEDDVLSQALEIENIDEDFDDILKELDDIEIDEDVSKSSDLEDLDSLLEMDDKEELSATLEEEFEDKVENIEEENFDDLLKDLELSNEDNDTVSIDKPAEEEINKGVEMAQDEFAQLDSLNEADILSALEDIDSVPVPSSPKKEVPSSSPSTSSGNVEISSSNVNDLAQLLGQLLNNKTLEITIKIKD